MNQPAIPPQNPDDTEPVYQHRLELLQVNLVGAGREVTFNPGLNHIIGDITTGKTTFVRLIRALLGTVPDDLPPEVGHVRAIRGHVALGNRTWQIYRPRTLSREALIEISEEHPDPGREVIAVRLPVAGAENSYSTFLLDQLRVPAISVPRARSEPGGANTPVTMTDWLGYCIITGDELDTEVFGHKRAFRDAKRRWVFEIAYGYYEPEIALLNADLRRVQLQLESMRHDAEVRATFLKETSFADVEILQIQLGDRASALEEVREARRTLGTIAGDVPGVQEIRHTLLAMRMRRADITDRLTRLEGQLKDLSDLLRQLTSQSARLTRAIVAGEWLVDFDFIVCPRCGNDVEPARTDPHLCYLCLQTPRPAPEPAELLTEQDRITSQLTETSEVIDGRRRAHHRLSDEATRLDETIAELSASLDQRTRTFISDQATQIEHLAARQAEIEADIRRLHEYSDLLRRHQAHMQGREQLEEKQEELMARIHSRELSHTEAEANVKALEQRMLEYLQALHIPDLGQELSVHINRRTYLPEVSGRRFDELSSQGLKTLVNIAHALAHHTVAIDRKLPLPGLLILDGISANSGQEGLSLGRIRDVYQLLRDVANQEPYNEALQIIAVDNELARDIIVDFVHRVALPLSQDDRLIRIPDGPDSHEE